jgi:hypothetical protein
MDQKKKQETDEEKEWEPKRKTKTEEGRRSLEINQAKDH